MLCYAIVFHSGGTTCLKLLSLMHASSKVTNNAANRGDP